MVTTEVKEESKKIANYADELVSLVDEWPSSTKTDELRRLSENLRRRAKDLRKDEFQLAVAGNYNAGKSTLINSLLGKRVLGVDRHPETGVVTYIRHVNSFEEVKTKKIGLESNVTAPDSPFGVVQFTDTDTVYDESSVRNRFKSFLQSDKVVQNTDGVGGIVAGLKSASTENIRELISQLLSGKGPSGGGYWSSQVSPDRLKKIAQEVVDNEDLVKDFEKWRDKLVEPPEVVEEGRKIVTRDNINRYTSKIKDNSNKKNALSEYVEQIDIFVESTLLEDGGVLVDLPGANTADSRDAEITLDYLGAGRVDAVLLAVGFDESAGLDDTMAQLVEKIQEQDHDVTERLFMAVNKVDMGFSSPEFFDSFLDTYKEHYEEHIKMERVFFLSSITNLFLSSVDPVYEKGKPSDKDVKDRMREIINENKGDDVNPEWKDFINALSGYTQEYPSHVEAEEGTFEDDVPSDIEIVEHISEEYPGIVIDALRLTGVEKDIPSVSSDNVGTHTMYDNLIRYMHKTQYENKIRRLRQDAESLCGEIIDILSSTSDKLINFPESREELSKDREMELRDSFRDAQSNIEDYISRVAIEAKDNFKEKGLKRFEGKTKDISEMAQKITKRANIDKMKSQIENRNPVSEKEEIRLCEELEVKDYRKDVKQGYFAEEVLSELVDMALRITAARLRQAVEEYIEGLYEELRILMRSDEVMFDADSEEGRPWSRSFLESLKESEILNSSKYEAYVEEDVLHEIEQEQLMSGKHTVSRLHPDEHSNWVSIYSGIVDEEEGDEDNLEMSIYMKRLVQSDVLDKQACRKVAENILKDISTEFIEKFNNREIGLYKSLTTDTLSEGTLSSRLEKILDPSGSLYKERIEELKNELEGNYEDMKVEMISKYNNHNSIYVSFIEIKENIDEILREVNEGFTVPPNDLSSKWSKVEERYGSNKTE